LKKWINKFEISWNRFRSRNQFDKNFENIKSISRWNQQFDHVNKIIATTFNSLILTHMRKLMCTLHSTKHEYNNSFEKWLIHTNFREQFRRQLISKQLKTLLNHLYVTFWSQTTFVYLYSTFIFSLFNKIERQFLKMFLTRFNFSCDVNFDCK
jgi:hypothetical protein